MGNTVSMQDLFKQIKYICAENNMGNNTIFVSTEFKQYYHDECSHKTPEIEFYVQIFFEKGGSEIKSFGGENPTVVLSHIREFFAENKIRELAKDEVVTDIIIEH